VNKYNNSELLAETVSCHPDYSNKHTNELLMTRTKRFHVFQCLNWGLGQSLCKWKLWL